LNRVVLPAPFGPITECSVPGSTFSETSLTAISAPNAFVSRSVLSTPRPQPIPRLDHAAAEELHHDHERHAQQQRPPLPDHAHRLGEPDEDEAADDGAVERAGAADERREHHVAREYE